MTENEILYLVIFIMAIAIVYLYYKISKTSEKFEVTDTTINNAISKYYKADIDSIRNLAVITKQIMDSEGQDFLRLPATNTIIKNLQVDGNVKFTNKNTNIIEIFPKYMVISWASADIPKGWALCDGKKYKITADGTTTETLDTDGINTPDLRGRFVLGSNPSKFTDVNQTVISERTLNDFSGEENHILDITEIPEHRHFVFYDGPFPDAYPNRVLAEKIYSTDVNVAINPGMIGLINNQSAPMAFVKAGSDSPNYLMISAWGNEPNVGKTSHKLIDYASNPVNSNKAHNNMPPFYVLTYIMKL